MTRIALFAAMAASLALAGAALAETGPGDKPAPKTAQPATPKADKQPAKPDAKAAAAKRKRVTYSCDGGISMVVTYPPEAQAKSGRVKIAMKDITYFARPVAGGDKYENKSIKLVFETKGEAATLERAGKPLAEKCKAAQPGS